MSTRVKRTLLIVAIVVLAIVLVVGGYVCYVFASSYRLDDNIELEVAKSGEVAGAEPQVGWEYSILSYNIGFGANSADFSFFMDGGTESVAKSPDAVRTNIAGITNAIKKADPSIVLIQEADVDGTRSHHINEVKLIDDALPDYSSRVFVQNYDSPFLLYPLTSPHGANKSGLYTLSKFDITSALRRSLPLEEGLSRIVDLDRCYAVNRVPVEGGGELVLYNMHLSAYTTDGTIAEEQLEMLFADMQSERELGNWTIAGGDFNKDLLGNSGEIFGVSGENYTWAQPIPAEAVPSDLSVVAPYDANDPVASCRNLDRPYDVNIFRVTVDGFVVSDNVEVVSSKVIDEQYKYSDHNPVEMFFKLEKH